MMLLSGGFHVCCGDIVICGVIFLMANNKNKKLYLEFFAGESALIDCSPK